MSHYEQDNYDPDTQDSGRCDECNKKYKNCKCPKEEDCFIKIPCDGCGKEFTTGDEGKHHTETVCDSCKNAGKPECSGEILF